MRRVAGLEACARGITALLCALSCSAPMAHAGPLETLRDVVLHPTDPSTFAVSYGEAGGGLLVTRDAGETFRLTCSAAIEGERNLGPLPPKVAWSGDGHLLVGTFQGLFRDDGSGCDFQRVSTLGDAYVADVVRDPDLPATLYALTSSGGKLNALYKSSDQGASFSPLAPPEDAFFQRLLIARRADGKRRFYLAVAEAAGADGIQRARSLRVSDDEGKSFATHVFAGARDLRLLALDRKLPDRVYASVTAPDRNSEMIYASDLGGEPGSWRELISVAELASLVPHVDGGFWALDAKRQQLVRWREGAEVQRIAGSSNLSCLAAGPSPEQTFVCATWLLHLTMPEHPESGRSVLDLNQVSTLASCAGEDLRASCREQLMYGWCGLTHYPEAPLCAQLTEERASEPAPDPAPVLEEAESASEVATPAKSRRHGDGCSLAALDRTRAGQRVSLFFSTLLLALTWGALRARQRWSESRSRANPRGSVRGAPARIQRRTCSTASSPNAGRPESSGGMREPHGG